MGLKIWAPLRKLFAPPGVPGWLRAWPTLTPITPSILSNSTVSANNPWSLNDHSCRPEFFNKKFYCRWESWQRLTQPCGTGTVQSNARRKRLSCSILRSLTCFVSWSSFCCRAPEFVSSHCREFMCADSIFEIWLIWKCTSESAVGYTSERL